VRLLLDTHLLLWAAEDSPRLSRTARSLISDARNEKWFSAASFWEIAIKNGRGRDDFDIDSAQLRIGMLANAYFELPVSSAHAILTATLPHFHKDPFDRILISQATAEGLTLLTADPIVAKYPGPIRLV
jgi:PIN domain nuclease of toxin-antitoxin system